ncbi:MAG: hypothetical protein MJE77_37170 [Proteobacteria bacterium]|nr:hypothetical protein [Pseudomonadota bacterium]
MRRKDPLGQLLASSAYHATTAAGIAALAGCLSTAVNDETSAVETSSVVVDPIEFMRSSSETPTLVADDGQLRSYYEEPGNRFYYVKSPDGRQYEQYSWNDAYIVLERDTSWPPGDNNGFNPAYDANPPGSLYWARSHDWAEGEVLSFSTYIAGWNYRPELGTTCRYDWEHAYQYEWHNGDKRYIYDPGRDFGGDVGMREAIGIEYAGASEVHWYARGLGWVQWEYRGTNPDLYTITYRWFENRQYRPHKQCADLGVSVHGFLDESTPEDPDNDWDHCRGKATCPHGRGIAGISVLPGGPARTAVCAGGAEYTGEVRGDPLTLDGGADVRRAHRQVNGSSDWAVGRLKLECGLNEYVVGVSQNANVCSGNNRFHGVLCARGAALSNTCGVRVFANGDSRGTKASGDWDVGAFKGECAEGEYVAGVSVDVATYRPHSLLCCSR